MTTAIREAEPVGQTSESFVGLENGPKSRPFSPDGRDDLETPLLPPPSGSREEAAQTARVVGYEGGLDSCIWREE